MRHSGDKAASLEWIRAHENLVLCGPAGTGKSHLLSALGHAAVAAGLRVRYFAGIELVETLYRGLADNSVGRILAVASHFPFEDWSRFLPETTTSPRMLVDLANLCDLGTRHMAATGPIAPA